MESKFKGIGGISGVVFHAIETGDAIREGTLEGDGFVLDDNYLYKAVGDEIYRFKSLGQGFAQYDCSYKLKLPLTRIEMGDLPCRE